MKQRIEELRNSINETLNRIETAETEYDIIELRKQLQNDIVRFCNLNTSRAMEEYVHKTYKRKRGID